MQLINNQGALTLTPYLTKKHETQQLAPTLT